MSTKAAVDTLLTFTQNGLPANLGDSYSGVWLNPYTLKLIIGGELGSIPTNATPPEIDQLIISINVDANLKTSANNSLASESVSASLAGTFGTKAGPAIRALVADDDDNTDDVFGDGDTITVKFTEPTNEPDDTPGDGLTKSDLDSIFTFSQYLGDDYVGEWSDSMTLKLTVIDSLTVEPPKLGEFRAIVKA